MTPSIQETILNKLTNRNTNAVNNSMNNLITSIVKYPLMIVTGIVVSRYLGPELKGIYVFLGMMGTVILPILFLGIGNGIQYYLSRESFSPKQTAFSAIGVGLITGLLLALAVYAIWSFQIFGKTGNEAPQWVVLVFVLALPFDGITYANRFILIGDNRFKFINYVYLANNALSFGILILAVVFVEDKLVAAATALCSIKVLLALAIVGYTIKRYAPTMSLNTTFLSLAYTYGIKSWIGNISARANDMLDQFIVGTFLNSAELGIYSISYAYVKLLTIPSNAISGVLFNEISFRNDLKGSLQGAVQVHKALLIITAALAVPLVLLGEWLIVTLYGEAFAGAYFPFLLLVPGIIVYAVSRRVLHKILAANGYPLKTSTIEFVSAVVGIILYIILIPRYGIVGGAIGSTIAYLVSGLVAYKLVYDLTGEHFGFFSFSIQDLYWIRDKVKLMSLKRIK